MIAAASSGISVPLCGFLSADQGQSLSCGGCEGHRAACWLHHSHPVPCLSPFHVTHDNLMAQLCPTSLPSLCPPTPLPLPASISPPVSRGTWAPYLPARRSREGCVGSRLLPRPQNQPCCCQDPPFVRQSRRLERWQDMGRGGGEAVRGVTPVSAQGECMMAARGAREGM